MSDIEILEREIAAIKDALHHKEMELYDLKLARWPFKIGDIVIATGWRHSGGEFKIVAYANVEYGWVTAVPRNKNGSWSKRGITLYDFEAVTPPNQEEH